MDQEIDKILLETLDDKDYRLIRRMLDCMDTMPKAKARDEIKRLLEGRIR